MNQNSGEFNPVIIVMAKAPQAGRVKTRLRPFLNDEQCAQLAVCFLKDTAAKAHSVLPNVVIAFTPAEDEKALRELLPSGTTLIDQKGNDLGERLASALDFAASRNFSPVILIGTDSPSLPADYLKDALNSFSRPQTGIVLGRAQDGGFYLCGLRGAATGIFENVEWGSEKVFEQTRANARKVFEREPVMLPVWRDVDRPDDLAFLYGEFLKKKNFAAPETAKWLEENKGLFDR